MSSLVVVAAAVILFFLGYRFYSRKIESLWDIDPKRVTPANEMYDGMDFVPARHWTILFGHHFSSIAGAAPIIGPVIALSIWGWGPALLWIVLGTIFIGGVHDFSSLMVSVRQRGSSIADIAEGIISKRAKIIFSIFIWLTLILVIAVFVFFCAKTLTIEPKIALPSLGLVPIAILVGVMFYNLRLNQIMTTTLGLALLAGLVILGKYVPVDLGKNALIIWSVILLLYSFVASITPVQILLQPRDYLSSFLLFIGIIFGYLGLIFSRSKVNIPMYIGWKGSEGLLWPMLFVTIACGAISGFHSLIASGTTSKQLPNEKDARKIGYGAMVMEGLVAVLAILAVAAGLKNRQALSLLISKGGSGPIGAFGEGYGEITKIILGGFGGLIAITILNAFILTTLDTATRIGRYLTQELFGIKSRYISTSIIVILSGLLALSGKWNKIWPAFGAANQLVAALALMVITCYFFSQRKLIRYTLVPSIFMLVTTIGALVYQINRYIRSKDYLLLTIAAVLVGLAIFMSFETLLAVRNINKSRCIK